MFSRKLLYLTLFIIPTFTTIPRGIRHKNYTEITTLSAYNAALASTKPVIMMFSAPWCHACNTMKPHFNTVASNHQDIEFYIIDTDQVKSITDKNNIRGLPTIIYSKNGKEIQRERGGMSKTEFGNTVHTFLASLAKPTTAEPAKTKKAKKVAPVPTTEKLKKPKKQQVKVCKKPKTKKLLKSV